MMTINKKQIQTLLSVMAAVLAFCIVTVSVLVCLDMGVYGVESAGATTEPPATDTSTAAPATTEPPATETEVPVTGGATSMAFEHDTDFMSRGETKRLIVVPTPAGTELPELTFASSDESVATVDDEGNVKTHAGGMVVIRASNADGTMACSCKITVLFSDIKLTVLENTGEKMASGFVVGVTVGDVRNDIAASHSLSRENVTVADKDKNPLADTESIRSGAYLTVDGVEYMTVLYGDINGDGLITNNDTKLILDYLTGKSGITQRACLLASDLAGEGEITLECALIVQRHVYNIQLITQ